MIKKIKHTNKTILALILGIFSGLLVLFGLQKSNNEQVLTNVDSDNPGFFFSLNRLTKVHADMPSFGQGQGADDDGQGGGGNSTSGGGGYGGGW